MQLDYEMLANIALDSGSRSTPAKDTSYVLAAYMQLLSNLIYAGEKLTESEMAMIISSLNRWITKKDLSISYSYGIGKIVQLDWGVNFSPELSYKHPAIIIEEWKHTVLVIPTTSTPAKITVAFHPVDNPNGKWFYRKVGTAEGFAHDCVLILNNAKIMSKARIMSISGNISGNINDSNNVFREIRLTMIQHFFSKEWIDYQKLLRMHEHVQKQNLELQNAYNKLLEENKLLKTINADISTENPPDESLKSN